MSTQLLSGHVNAIEIVAAGDGGRRRRRTHSPQFKAAVVAACRQPGVSIASVALANRLNANLVRRWVDAQEHSGVPGRSDRVGKPTPSSASGEPFIPITIEASKPSTDSIQIELRRGTMAVKLAWPIGAAAECAAWLRDLLR